MTRPDDDWMMGGVVENDREEARTERRWPGPATRAAMDDEHPLDRIDGPQDERG